MKKGGIGEVRIERVAFPGKGKGRVGDETVTVRDTIPGQKVRFVVSKKRNGTLTGRLLQVMEPSPLETRSPLCSLFPRCGGCTYQTMGYEHQLAMKEQQIRDILFPVLENTGMTQQEFDAVFEGITGAPREYPFRNKMEYTFGDEEKGGELTLGLHKKGSRFDILPATDCAIAPPDFNRITACVQEYCRQQKLPFYQKVTHEGFLRNLLLRKAERTGEILAALVTTTQAQHDFSSLVNQLLELKTDGTITGILHIFFDGVADIVQSDRTEVLYGKDFITEELLGLRFRISPFSFFQTNTCGAETLYNVVRDYIGDVTDARVFDLYSGTGTIAQMLAPAAGYVTGIEIVEEAVTAAKENAQANGITNCDFLCGDVLKVLDEVPERPDYIILDPPRDGIHPKALPKILDYGVRRIVYVSCKPTSLARDLETFLLAGYRPERIRCVDMFPESVHVETVCLLSNKNAKLKDCIEIGVDAEDYYRIKDSDK